MSSEVPNCRKAYPGVRCRLRVVDDHIAGCRSGPRGDASAVPWYHHGPRAPRAEPHHGFQRAWLSTRLRALREAAGGSGSVPVPAGDGALGTAVETWAAMAAVLEMSGDG